MRRMMDAILSKDAMDDKVIPCFYYVTMSAYVA